MYIFERLYWSGPELSCGRGGLTPVGESFIGAAGFLIVFGSLSVVFFLLPFVFPFAFPFADDFLLLAAFRPLLLSGVLSGLHSCVVGSSLSESNPSLSSSTADASFEAVFLRIRV